MRRRRGQRPSGPVNALGSAAPALCLDHTPDPTGAMCHPEPVPFRERLLPRWWVWVVVAGLVAMLAIAYGAALGAVTGWTVGIVGGVASGWLLWITAPTIRVDAEYLFAGGARLPRACVGTVEVVEGERLATLLREDARVFTVVRPWSARAGVRVSLEDPQDPHPAWLLSSRSPDRLARALVDANAH